MQENIAHLYSQLLEKYREMTILSSAAGVLSWDMMTKMPPRGINLRSQQLAVLGGIAHRMATDPDIGKSLDRIENDSGFADLNEVSKRNIHLIRKSYNEQSALPESLVIELQRQTSIANDVWRKAKEANDWNIFYPELEKNIELTKQAADILMNVKKTETPYDALIDIYEPGMTARRIDVLFTELREGLVALIDKIKRSPVKADLSILEHRIPADVQSRIALALAEAIGYDVVSSNAPGRIDETEHPFTTGYYDDVRVTTHYFEDRFASSVFSVLHEGGHALYELDLEPDWIYQPVGSACSTGIHESQSRLIENMVGRSPEFWTYFLPRLKEITAEYMPDVSLEDFILAINHVEPSKIRIEADEVTYSLHVIIRFEIEKELFAGRINVKDLPEIWNQSYNKYLGVNIENYAEGVMQDMHWSAGNFGYFPCYALGNIYSGQMLARIEQNLPEWRKDLEKGDFRTVKDWLAINVHKPGNLYDPADLIKKITGSEVAVGPYLSYLNEKYSGLYHF